MAARSFMIANFTNAASRAAHIALAALCVVALLAAHSTVWARGVYQTPEKFIEDAYGGKPPAPKIFWLTEARQADVARILGHKYPAARLRYWMHEGRSAWVLEEVGKEEPITVGIVVDRGKLGLVRVLEFRESRGDEVRHPFFTKQFEGVALEPDGQLNRSIDGITGATLSVRALTKLTRLALYFHGQVAE